MANNVKLKPNVYMTITPTLTSQSVANNTSVVKVVVNLRNPSGTYKYSGWGSSATRIRYVVKNGSTVLLDTGLIDYEYQLGSLNVINQSFTIAHSGNGSVVSNAFSVTISGGANQGLAYTTGTTADTTIVIPQIPRASSFTLGGATTTNSAVTVSITRADNSFTHEVKWKVGSGGTHSIDNVATSTSFTVQPNTSGMTNYASRSVSVTVVTKSGNTVIGTASAKTRTITIPKSTLTSISGTPETNKLQTANISSTGGSGLTESYKWTLGSTTSTSGSTWTPLHGVLPNSTSGTLRCELITKNGSATVGTDSKSRTLTVPSSVVPSVGTIDVDENAIKNIINLNVGLANGKHNKFIQNKSRVKIEFSGSAGSGATIKSYKITFAGQTLNASSGTTQIITQKGTLPIVCTVTDSRGRSTPKTQNVTVYEYLPPIIERFDIYRSDSLGNRNPSGAYAVLDIKVSASKLDNKNTLSYQMQRRNAGSGTFANVGSAKTGNPISDDTPISATVTQDYDLRVVLTDVFGTVNITNPTLYIPRAGVNFFVGSRGTGSGFGIIPGKTYDLEIGTRGLKAHGKIIDEDGEIVTGRKGAVAITNYSSSVYTTATSTMARLPLIATRTITVSKDNATVVVQGSAVLRTTAQVVRLQVYIDGSAVGSMALSDSTVERTMITMGVKTGLSKGNHTVELRWSVQSTSVTGTAKRYESATLMAWEV